MICSHKWLKLPDVYLTGKIHVRKYSWCTECGRLKWVDFDKGGKKICRTHRVPDKASIRNKFFHIVKK